MANQIYELNQKMFESDLAVRFKAEEVYGLPVDCAVTFSNHKCIYKPTIERKQRKFLRKLVFLTPFLLPGEVILHATCGCQPASFVEQVLTGFILGSIKRILLVITNKRILHIPTTLRLTYRGSISKIMFADCRKIRIGFSGLTVNYKSGRNERFRCIDRASRKKIKTILKTVSFEGKTSTTLERTHICPRCTKPLIKGCYICPSCGLKFKTHAWATILSIIFPGGGYFYIRRPLLGIMAAASELLFVFLLTVSSIVFIENYAEDPKYLAQAVALCAIAIVYQKLTTSLFSCKCIDEFIPKKRRVEVKIEEIIADRSTPQFEDMLATRWRSI
jgi:hypothetical protein